MLFWRSPVRPLVVKQILLGPAGVGAEMRVGELAEVPRSDLPPWKIDPPQRALDPDIDRKRLVKATREQQDAIRYLFADTGQFEELGKSLFVFFFRS